MRRFVPWALLGVLTVGVAAFAALGQVESPGLTPSQWLASVLSTTSAAGSAQLHFMSHTTSASPLPPSTTIGEGVVDFSTGSYRITELTRQGEYESTNGGPALPALSTFGEQTIAIGQTVYRDFTLSSPVPASGWEKSTFPRNVHQAFGLDAGTAAENAIAGLALITPVASVQRLGPDNIDGVAATRFRMTSEPLYVCGPHSETLSVPIVGPTTVWIDGRGRLLQTQVTQHVRGESAPKPYSTGATQVTPLALSASTTVSTLTFSDFGAPVHITAPLVSGPQPKSINISLKSEATTTPCR